MTSEEKEHMINELQNAKKQIQNLQNENRNILNSFEEIQHHFEIEIREKEEILRNLDMQKELFNNEKNQLLDVERFYKGKR